MARSPSWQHSREPTSVALNCSQRMPTYEAKAREMS